MEVRRGKDRRLWRREKSTLRFEIGAAPDLEPESAMGKETMTDEEVNKHIEWIQRQKEWAVWQHRKMVTRIREESARKEARMALFVARRAVLVAVGLRENTNAAWWC
jgi:hypothetical protein